MQEHPDLAFGKTAPAEPTTAAPLQEDLLRRGTKPRNQNLGGINPNNRVHMTRLRESMQHSARAFKPFRDAHIEAVKTYAGTRYGYSKDADARDAVNILRLAIDVWSRQLVSQSPRCVVLTRSPALTTSAYELELATNFVIQEIQLGRSLEDIVRTALFTMGIAKIGITDQYMNEAVGFTNDSGVPFCDPVLLEDWLHDMNARRQEEWDWCGNRYRVPIEYVMENPDFDSDAKNEIHKGLQHNAELEGLASTGSGAKAGYRKESELSKGMTIEQTEYTLHTELWDLWLPRDNLVVTLSHSPGSRPLLVREWEGPENGPYHLLMFSRVPGNLMPLGPVQSLIDSQDLMTVLFNQLGSQAKRQKTVTLADGKSVQDGTAGRITNSSDGDVIHCNHPDTVKEMRYGGVDDNNFRFVVWLRETMSYLAGNLDALGGLAQQGRTLGQEQLLVESSSEMLRDMQTKVVNYTQKVIQDLSYWTYSDPTLELNLVKPITDFGDVPFTYGPDSRIEDFYNFHFRVVPYSLNNQAPGQRLQQIMTIFNQVLLPLAPQLSEFGMTINMQTLMELISKYSDLPEIANLISSEVPMMGEEIVDVSKLSGRRPLQSPSTTRHHIRENVTNEPQGARDANLMQALATAIQQGGGQ